jgi:hypothetical protein
MLHKVKPQLIADQAGPARLLGGLAIWLTSPACALARSPG